MSRPARFAVIVGPTAGGKSDLALALARRLARRDLHPAVLAADSMQVYRGMDIGTAKPAPAERGGFPHRLIDLVGPTERFTVDDWLRHAEAELDAVRAGRLAAEAGSPGIPGVPIVVGGTHLYVKALLEGLFEGPGQDERLRAELAALDPAQRRAELERVDPEAARRIHPADVRRTIRALEVYRLTGTPISVHQRQWDSGSVRADALLIVLDWPVEALNRRINARVRDMMDRGLLEEVRRIAGTSGFGPQAAEALGYKQLLAHLRGECRLDDAVEQIKIETRRFAKNQRTWLRRLRTTPGALVVPMGGPEAPESAADAAERALVEPPADHP